MNRRRCSYYAGGLTKPGTYATCLFDAQAKFASQQHLKGGKGAKQQPQATGKGKGQLVGFTDHNAKWLKPKRKQPEPEEDEDEDEDEEELNTDDFANGMGKLWRGAGQGALGRVAWVQGPANTRQHVVRRACPYTAPLKRAIHTILPSSPAIPASTLSCVLAHGRPQHSVTVFSST